MFANALVLLVLINLLASRYFFRADLTEEKALQHKTPDPRDAEQTGRRGVH